MNFAQITQDCRALIEADLEQRMSGISASDRLAQSMRYSTLGGGKRIRGLLAIASCSAVTGRQPKSGDPVLAIASALEMLHAYSLIHDDLPSMDDDDLRRGKPTNHLSFDEATAILAGDALQSLAFETVCDQNLNLTDTQVRAIVETLSKAAGARGMVAGQMIDVLATDKVLSKDQLDQMHSLKTGALIRAAVVMGGLCEENVSESQLQHLQLFGESIGLAFQVTDDILDIEASTEQLGKRSGADTEAGKATYPAILGLEVSKQIAAKLQDEAMESARALGDNSGLLCALAKLIISRSH